MDLTIITPISHQTFAIAWLELATTAGNFVIQPGHAPTVLTLTPAEKVTFCLANGKRDSIVVSQGIAHITRTTATLLLNESP